jgi:DNA-binding CsgD family transcriptional regulator
VQESADLSDDRLRSHLSAWAAMALAGALLQSGDPRRAAEVLITSAGGDELSLTTPNWRAHSLELLMRCLLASDRPEAARRALRRLGRHIHRRSRPGQARHTGVASLTEREHEIARLIVDRKTNAELADELFLSKKTIETHIRNMFRKLDVTSRAEIARAVEQADRAAAP